MSLHHHPITRQDAIVGVLFSLISAIGFSGKAILVKLAYQDPVDAVTLLALRMLFAAPVFIAIALWARKQHAEPLSRHDKVLVVVVGLLGYYLSSYLDFLGLQYISASLERLILFLYPTMTVVLAALIYRRHIGKKIFAAMALSYAGIALVFLHNVHMQEAGVVLGSTLVFFSTLSYSLYLVGAGHAIRRVGTVRFTAYAMLVACGACLLQYLFTHPLAIPDVTPRVYGLAVAMAIFSTVLPVMLQSYAIHRIGSSNASLISSVGPVSTIYLAYLFLNEAVSLLQMAGSALVLAGVLIVSLNTRRADR